MKASEFRANLAWTESEAAQYLLPLSQKILARWFPLHDDPPDPLYHYTNVAGLLGIIQSDTLWATHSSYLNDPSEIVHAHALIQLAIKDRLEIAQRPVSRELLSRALYAIDPNDGMYQYFVSSFCQEPDLLGQWRAYSRSGGGYAIGFDSLALQRTANPSPALTLRRVIYNHDQQRVLISQTLDDVMDSLEGVAGTKDPTEASALIALFVSFLRDHFAEFHFSFKNQAYKDEQEWRLIVQAGVAARDALLRDVCFREADGIPVPYLALGSDSLAGRPNGQLPLTNIVYGPAIDEQRAVHSVRMLLDKYGYSHVNMTSSEVPLRA
jgi:hypothetical protein